MLKPHTVNIRTPQVKAVFWDFVCCNSKEAWSCNSKEALCLQTRVWICNSKKVSGERLRRKLCFVCNLKDASGESCVFDALSKLMLKPHTVNLRTP